MRVFGSDMQPLDYDGLKEVTLLERCLKESLRLRPPIMTMMRMCKKPLVRKLAIIQFCTCLGKIFFFQKQITYLGSEAYLYYAYLILG